MDKALQNMDKLYAVIMAGGRGERFWPQSDSRRAKQFLPILSDRTLIQETFDRITPMIPPERVLVVTSKEQAGLVKRQLVRLSTSNIIKEPMPRNTAACIGLAAIIIEKKNPDGIMIVLPSDHMISDRKAFLSVLRTGVEIANKGDVLVTLGIEPTFPATGYGYIKQGSLVEKKGNVFRVERFVEKPDKETASSYLKSGEYFWNSGIFIWKVSTILKAIEKYLPRLDYALKKIKPSLGTRAYQEVASREYENLEKISIDYGVLEKAQNIYMLKAKFGWDDVGSWGSLLRCKEKDREANVCEGQTALLDTKGSVFISKEKQHLIAAIGVSDLIVVHTRKATLICHKEDGEKVKNLVEILGENPELRRYL